MDTLKLKLLLNGTDDKEIIDNDSVFAWVDEDIFWYNGWTTYYSNK